jgi:hypothetical protein
MKNLMMLLHVMKQQRIIILNLFPNKIKNLLLILFYLPTGLVSFVADNHVSVSLTKDGFSASPVNDSNFYLTFFFVVFILIIL